MRKALAALAVAASIVAGGFVLQATPSQAAVTQLYLAQYCLPDGSVRVDFSWRGNDPSATQQWLDLSLFNNGWEWGTFLGAGPMPGQQTALRWDGLIPNATHYVRVNQQFANGVWDPSPTFYFTTANCVPTLPPPAPQPAPGFGRFPAPIDGLEVRPLGGGHVLRVQAGLPGGCAVADGHDVSRSGSTFTVRVWNQLPVDGRPCTLIYGSYDVQVPLTGLTPGVTYTFRVNDKMVTYTP